MSQSSHWAVAFYMCFDLTSFYITMPKETGKRKKVVLTIQQKLEILDKLKAGQSGTSIAHEYGIGNATVTDVKKAEPQLRQFTQKHLPVVFHHKNKDSGLRTMKLGKYQNLDEALFKWQQQHVSSGLPTSALANAWNPLLRGHEDMREVFEGFDREVREVKEALGDYETVTEEDVQEWLTVDEGDPGYAL